MTSIVPAEAAGARTTAGSGSPAEAATEDRLGGVVAPLAPRARLLPSLAAVYRAQLSRARVARIPLLFVATFQSVGIMILMRGVVDGGSEARAVVAGSSVLVVAFVALNLLAQYFGQLRAAWRARPLRHPAGAARRGGARCGGGVCLLHGARHDRHRGHRERALPVADDPSVGARRRHSARRGSAVRAGRRARTARAPAGARHTARTARHVRGAAAGGAATAGCPRRSAGRAICCPRRTGSRPCHGRSTPIPTGRSSSLILPSAP